MSTKSYENSGLLVLDPPEPARKKTIVVIGLARSGTSLVAGSLHELGVWMGAKAPPPVYEDMELGSAIESGDFSVAHRIIRRYDTTHAVWGWKRPASLHHLDAIHELLRNPLYVVVFRDIFAIANRNRVSVGSDVLKSMRRSVDEYAKLLDFLERKRPPALLVSYDKALRHKEAFVEQVCAFLDLPADRSAKERALAFITPSPRTYQEVTRTRAVVGHLDVIQEDLVFGWAAAHPENRRAEPLQVTLQVNGRVLATMKADLERPDLVKNGAHATGKAGFAFKLQGNDVLRGGDEIRVFAGKEGEELQSSPRRFESAHLDFVKEHQKTKLPKREASHPLLFLHIPKTAGTSLRALFSERIPRSQIAVLDPPISSEAREQVTKQRANLRLLMGHLYFGIDEQLGLFADYVTFLRDPVARIASFWKHQQTHKHAEFHAEAKRGMSLREFVESERTLQTDNHMTRILIGTAESGLLDGSLKRIEESRYLEKALAHARSRFRFIGFMEHYEASARALGKTLDWPEPATTKPRLNALNSTACSLDQGTIEAIRRHNALDIALYETLAAEATWLSNAKPLVH